MAERDNKNDPIGPGKTGAAGATSTPPAPATRTGEPVASPDFGPPPPQLGPNDPVPEPPSLYGNPEERKAKSDEIKAAEEAATEPPPEEPPADGETQAQKQAREERNRARQKQSRK